MLVLKNHLNPKLKTFWTNNKYFPLPYQRYRVLYGGRASSKSHEICTMLILHASLEKKTILCTRAFQNKIQDSVKSLLESKIIELGLSTYFTITKTSITSSVGSNFLFYGLARNTAEIKGLEGIDICYVEEAQYITKDMFDLLAPTIRKQNSELWIAFNPKNYYDYIYQQFIVNQRAGAKVQMINYIDNPFLSKTMLEEIESFMGDDDFNHVYLGEVTDDNEQNIVKLKWLLACVDAFKILGIKRGKYNYVGYDVADAGEDSNCVVCNKGGEIVAIDEWRAKEDELDKSTKRAVKTTLKLSPRATMVYDSIGVGAGVGAIIKNLKTKPYIHKKFIASATPNKPNSMYKYLGTATAIKNKDAFENLKAQQWQLFADKAKATYNAVVNGADFNKEDIISFSSKIPKKILDKAFKELSTPNRENAEDKKMKVESKKSLQKRGVPSPNIADAVIMSCSKTKTAF